MLKTEGKATHTFTNTVSLEFPVRVVTSHISKVMERAKFSSQFFSQGLEPTRICYGRTDALLPEISSIAASSLKMSPYLDFYT